jgi:hypothetical protein
MMPDLGDVTVGPGDVMALRRQSLTPVKRPPPWSVRIRQRARYGVSDASHACGLDDLNAGLASRSRASRLVRSTRPTYLGGASRHAACKWWPSPCPPSVRRWSANHRARTSRSRSLSTTARKVALLSTITNRVAC